MKLINWRVRFKNAPWVLGLIGVVIAFVYQVLGMFDIVPAISQDEVTQIVGLVVNVLIALGVLVDPTTSGVSDSKLALTYSEPRRKKDQTVIPTSEREYDGKNGGWL